MDRATGPAGENAFDAWEGRYAELSRLASEADAAAEADGLDIDAIEQAGEVFYRQRDNLEEQIVDAPCTSPHVAAVKLRLALKFIDDETQLDGRDLAMVAEVASYLDGSPTAGISLA